MRATGRGSSVCGERLGWRQERQGHLAGEEPGSASAGSVSEATGADMKAYGARAPDQGRQLRATRILL